MFKAEECNLLTAVDSSKSLAQRYVNKHKSSFDRGIDFQLNILEFAELFSKTHCDYSGIPFTDSGNCELTLERINPLAGYVNGNVIAVTKKANSDKSHLDNFIHSKSMTVEQKISVMNRVIYRLKKQLKQGDSVKS